MPIIPFGTLEKKKKLEFTPQATSGLFSSFGGFQTSTPKTTTSNTIIPFVNFVASVAQAAPRAAISSALTLIGQDSYSPGTKSPFPLVNRAEQFFLGAEPVRDIKTRGEQLAGDFGASNKTANILAFPVGIALTALDFSGFGGGKSKVIETIAKSTNVGEILSILNKMGVPEDLAKIYASQFTKITKPAEIKAGLEALENTMKSTVRKGAETLP